MPIAVFDGHNDVLLEERSFLEESGEGHLDLARARAGGFAGGFFALFTPHPDGYADDTPEPPVSHALALRTTLAGAGKLLALEAEGAVLVVRGPEDLVLDEPIRAVMHIEGAEAIDRGLERLPELHALGLRSVGITWSRPNVFGHGVGDDRGLTDAGRALVRACEELGILVDLAHLSERGFWDVAEMTERPLVVSHACAAALVPHERNLSDRQLDAVRDSGGVVGVCFHHEHVGPQRTDIARHVHHLAERMGAEHVALGSDFDGCDLPAGIRGAQDLPLVLDDIGWGDAELRLVAHENFLRVLRQAQNAASSRARPTGSS